MESFDFILAGANFRPAETKEFIRHELETGSSVTFEREPTNPYDENAIRVLGHDSQDQEFFIGFVPKSDNLLLSQYLAEGGTAEGEVISFVGDIKPVVRVTFPDGTA